MYLKIKAFKTTVLPMKTEAFTARGIMKFSQKPAASG
jgi:hypothetical protein